LVRSLDHRDVCALALHDSADRDFRDEHAGGAVAFLHDRRSVATRADEADERIAAAFGVVGVRLRRLGRGGRRRSRTLDRRCRRDRRLRSRRRRILRRGWPWRRGRRRWLLRCGRGCRRFLSRRLRRRCRLRLLCGRGRRARLLRRRAGGGEREDAHDYVFAAPGFAGVLAAGFSSSTKVVAVHEAEIVNAGVGLSLPLMSTLLMLTMRVNLPTRSKKSARLWYVPSSW